MKRLIGREDQRADHGATYLRGARSQSWLFVQGTFLSLYMNHVAVQLAWLMPSASQLRYMRREGRAMPGHTKRRSFWRKGGIEASTWRGHHLVDTTMPAALSCARLTGPSSDVAVLLVNITY
jgi:hypothetical protein